jgi:DNA (cytosine-5)-methyltransferase 1
MEEVVIKDVWHTDVPIEKSAYLSEEDHITYNSEHFKYDKNKPVMIDLFSGAGGFSVGAGWAGFQSVLGTDYFKPALSTWMKNHPDAMAILGDIKKLNEDYLDNLLKEKGIEKVHLITGGVPCQGFSLASRKHKDDDERNYLFLDYMRIVERIKPDYIILENVTGMQSTAGGKFVEDILAYMEKIGYSSRVKLLNAAEFGVPQVRRRVIFVGVRKGRGLNENYEYPVGEYSDLQTEIDLFSQNFEKKPYRNVKDAISDLPKINSGENATQYIDGPMTEYQKFMRGYVSGFEKNGSSVLLNHKAPKHPESTIKKIAETEPGKPMYEKFKQRIRLDYDKPSPTQLAGGIRPQFQFGHPELARGLSIRERARIQSFPDSYEFTGGTVQERVQTGNAVPPLLIYHVTKIIAEDLLRVYPNFRK